MTRQIVAGQHVYDAKCARKSDELGAGQTFNSEALCRWQQSEARYGIIEAEIVASNYGFSVRYASGLQNFGLLASSRAREIDGTYEGAVTWAKAWAARDPDRRFVTAWSA